MERDAGGNASGLHMGLAHDVWVQCSSLIVASDAAQPATV